MSSIDTSFAGTGIPLSSTTSIGENFSNNNNNNNITTPQSDVLNANSIGSGVDNTINNSSSTATSAAINGAFPKTPISNTNNNITDSINMSSNTAAAAGTSFNSNATTNTNNNSSSSNKSTDPLNAGDAKRDGSEEKKDDSMYECNICLDTAKDAVVSMCGHLFCWPCLHQWLETRPTRKLCPVCKAAISKEKVIPLYGRNTTKQEDPRNKVPPRPAGQRSEPEPAPGFQGFGFGDGGFHMSFGIGAFPFGYFASSFNIGEPRATANQRASTQYEEEQNLSKIFLYIAVFCIGWLLFA